MPTARTLHLTNPLMKGPDVKRAQVLLAKAGYLATKDIDGSFGPHTANACELAKYKLGYPSASIQPTCGAALIGYLTGTPIPKAYQEYKAARAGVPFIVFEENALRAKIVSIAMWGVHNTPQIHYLQRRPIDGINHPYQLPLYTDCSGFVTLCYKWAGAPDPNGRGFDGLGFTGTLMDHCKPIMKSQAKPADIIVYGPYPGHHTVLITTPGIDPAIVSHGQENDPRLARNSNEEPYQPAPAHYLRLPEWSHA